jgi:hypothetical protein
VEVEIVVVEIVMVVVAALQDQVDPEEIAQWQMVLLVAVVVQEDVVAMIMVELVQMVMPEQQEVDHVEVVWEGLELVGMGQMVGEVEQLLVMERLVLMVLRLP